jgi:hypothetical protein
MFHLDINHFQISLQNWAIASATNIRSFKTNNFFKKNVGGGVSDLWYTLKGLGVHYEVEFYCHKLLSNVHTRVLVMTFSDNVTLGSN